MELVRSSGTVEIFAACAMGLVLGTLALVSPIAAILAVAAVAYIWISLTHPVVLGYTVIAAATFTSGMPRGRLLPLLIPNEAVLLLSFALAFPLVLLVYRYKIPKPILIGFSTLIVGTVVIPFFSYYTRGTNLSTGAMMGLLAPIQFVLMFVIFFMLGRDEQVQRRLINFMLICAALVALVGLLQAFNVEFINTFLRQWYPSLHLARVGNDVNRVTSVFGAWNTLGTFLMVSLLLCVALISKAQTRVDYARLLIVGALCSMCLLASGSFAGIGGLVAGIGIIKIFDRSGLKAILVGGLILIVISVIALQPILAERLEWQYGGGESGLIPQTLLYRFKIWEEIFLPVVARHPLGAIYPTLQGVSWGYAESQYIGLHYRTGLFSLLAHLTWVTMTLVWLYPRLKRQDSMTGTPVMTVFTVLILLSVMGLTNEVFTYSGVMDYLWILLALASSTATEVV